MCWVEIFTCVIFERIAFFCSYFQHIGAYFMFIIITANELVVLEFCSYFSFLLSLSCFFAYSYFYFTVGCLFFFCGNSSSCLLNHTANYAKTRKKRRWNEWMSIYIVCKHTSVVIFSDYSHYVCHIQYGDSHKYAYKLLLACNCWQRERDEKLREKERKTTSEQER